MSADVRGAEPDLLPILCERCGYDVDSLSARLPTEPGLGCPECAEPVLSSMPGWRMGTPWQRQWSLVSYLRTAWALTITPRRVFRAASGDHGWDRGLMSFMVALVTGTAIALLIILEGGVANRGYRALLGAAVLAVFAGLLYYVAAMVPSLLLVRVRMRHDRRGQRALVAVVCEHSLMLLAWSPAISLIGAGVLGVSRAITMRSSSLFASPLLMTLCASLALPLILVLRAAWIGSGVMRYANPARVTLDPSAGVPPDAGEA